MGITIESTEENRTSSWMLWLVSAFIVVMIAITLPPLCMLALGGVLSAIPEENN